MQGFSSQLSGVCELTGSHRLVSEIMNLDQFVSKVFPSSSTAGISGKGEGQCCRGGDEPFIHSTMFIECPSCTRRGVQQRAKWTTFLVVLVKLKY